MNIDKIENLGEYVQSIVCEYVDFPSELETHVSVSTKTVIIQLTCAKSDLGKIIGKSGRTITSLQTIISAAKNTKFPSDNKKVIIEVLE
jgi:uncharacterized protein